MVRIRQGISIKLADRSAQGGEWIEVARTELEAPAFRRAVETAEDIAEAAAKKVAVVANAQITGGSMFDAFRRQAIDQRHQWTKREAAEVERGAARLAARAAQMDEGYARELLGPPAPAAVTPHFAVELNQTAPK